MHPPRLRPVDPIKDASALAAIYAPYVREAWASFEGDPPSASEMQERAETILNRDLPYMVAEDADGQILGYAYVSPYRARTAYRYSVESSIYLASEAQGKGMAKALMDALIDQCLARNLKTMVAIVGLDPDVPAEQNQSVRFHQKYGFRFVGVLDNIGHKFDRWTGTAVLVLDLGER